MQKNKRNERHVSLKNPEVIGLVERLAEAKGINLYEACEALILNTVENMPVKEVTAINTVVIDKCGYGELVNALITNGYRVDITPKGEELIIKFRKEN